MSVAFVRTMDHALRGEGVHVEVLTALDGMDWRLAGREPAGAPHTVFKLLNHMIFWQDLFLQRLTGAVAPTPAQAAVGWPGGEVPASEGEWLASVGRFHGGLALMQSLVSVDTLDDPLPNWNHRTRAEAIVGTASHNSYHLGQIVLLRRMLGAWATHGRRHVVARARAARNS